MPRTTNPFDDHDQRDPVRRVRSINQPTQARLDSFATGSDFSILREVSELINRGMRYSHTSEGEDFWTRLVTRLNYISHNDFNRSFLEGLTYIRLGDHPESLRSRDNLLIARSLIMSHLPFNNTAEGREFWEQVCNRLREIANLGSSEQLTQDGVIRQDQYYYTHNFIPSQPNREPTMAEAVRSSSVRLMSGREQFPQTDARQLALGKKPKWYVK